jgi:hypothetical protein
MNLGQKALQESISITDEFEVIKHNKVKGISAFLESQSLKNHALPLGLGI